MAKYLIEDSTLTAISDAIRSKTGSTEQINLSDIPNTIEEMSGGDVLNGIIQSYMAETETINANTFIEFAQRMKNGEKPTIGNISTSISPHSSGRAASAVLLEENKVFIAYAETSSTYSINAAICTIENSSITVNTSGFTLVSGSEVCIWPDSVVACALTSNSVVVGYDYNSSGEYAYAIACKIDGNTITKGNAVSVSTSSQSGARMSIERLNDAKAVMAYGSQAGVYAIVLSVSNSLSISKGTKKAIKSSGNFPKARIVKLTDTTMLVCYNLFDGYFSNTCHCVVISISGTTISVGTVVDLGYGDLWDILTINANKVCVLYGGLSASICTISGTSINVVNTQNNFSLCPDSTSTSPSRLRAIYFAESSLVYMCYGQTVTVNGSSIKKYYALICSLSDDNIITKAYEGEIYSDSNMGDTNVRLLKIDSDRLLVGISVGGLTCLYQFVSYIGTVEDVVRVANTKIEGITKTACTTTTPGEVWVLNA